MVADADGLSVTCASVVLLTLAVDWIRRLGVGGAQHPV